MNILTSRRFMTLLLDTAVSIALYYWKAADATFMIAALQPIFLALITSYTVEGTIRIKQGLSWK